MAGLACEAVQDDLVAGDLRAARFIEECSQVRLIAHRTEKVLRFPEDRLGPVLHREALLAEEAGGMII